MCNLVTTAQDYALNLTGTTVRKKFVFKVYGAAHYMDVSGK
ncbi:MAG: chalcone isomerase family protein [Calditrichia bacterium]